MEKISNLQSELEKTSSGAVKNYERDLTEEISNTQTAWDTDIKGLQDGLAACLNGVKEKMAATEEDFKQREAGLSTTLQKIDGQFKTVLEKANAQPGIKKSAMKLTEQEKEAFFADMCTKIDAQTGSKIRGYERKFRQLNVKYNQDVLSLRSQMEQVRDWLNEQVSGSSGREEAPDEAISKTLTRIEKVATHLEDYSANSFKNLDEILNGIAEQMAIVNKKYCDPSLKEEAQAMVQQIDESLVACKAESKEVETRVNSDLYRLEEMMVQADEAKSSLTRKGDLKASKREKVNQEVQKLEQLRGDTKDLERKLKRKMADNKEQASTMITGLYGLTKKLDLAEAILTCMKAGGSSPAKSAAPTEPEKAAVEATPVEETKQEEEVKEEEQEEVEGEEEEEEGDDEEGEDNDS